MVVLGGLIGVAVTTLFWDQLVGALDAQALTPPSRHSAGDLGQGLRRSAPVPSAHGEVPVSATGLAIERGAEQTQENARSAPLAEGAGTSRTEVSTPGATVPPPEDDADLEKLLADAKRAVERWIAAAEEMSAQSPNTVTGRDMRDQAEACRTSLLRVHDRLGFDRWATDWDYFSGLLAAWGPHSWAGDGGFKCPACEARLTVRYGLRLRVEFPSAGASDATPRIRLHCRDCDAEIELSSTGPVLKSR